MRDVLDELLRWWRAGAAIGLATVTATWDSAPREVGAAMLVGPDGTVAGSVSGGCVEAAVYELCREAVATGRHTVARYGVSDDAALDAGLTCGGTVEVFVSRVDTDTFPELEHVAAAIADGRPAAVVTCVDGPAAGRRLTLIDGERFGTLGGARLDAAAAEDAAALLAAGRTGSLHYRPDDERANGPHGERPGAGAALFVQSFVPPARMLVFGATDHAAALADVGAFLGYRVTVCDARSVFATRQRFPHAHEVVVDWPHRYLAAEAAADRVDARTVVCVLTHDPRFDVPVLRLALDLPVGYVGAMGSRRTHDDRLRRLTDAGVRPDALARLASPIGLDLGARTPQETAISIAAEIVAARQGGTGGRLSDMAGPIHRQAHQDSPVRPGMAQTLTVP